MVKMLELSKLWGLSCISVNLPKKLVPNDHNVNFGDNFHRFCMVWLSACLVIQLMYFII